MDNKKYLINQRDELARIVLSDMPTEFQKKHISAAEKIADNLIAHGVTVQEWISVKDRLPENIGLYLVIEKHWLDGSRGIEIAKWNTVDWFTADIRSKEITPRVTHWMPMPELPKRRC